MMADALLWLAAIGIPVLLIFALAAAVGLLLCRYDQRHDRDIDLDVVLGQHNLSYHSRRPHDRPTQAPATGRENVYPLPAGHRTPADAQNHPTQPATPIAERRAATRRQATAAENREYRKAA
jgi:hypothetical protein